MHKALALLLVSAAAVTALLLVPSALATEPNDAFSNATFITPGLWGPYDIDPMGDNDYFAFTLAGMAEVTFETDGNTSEDSVLYLYDSSQSYLAYNDDYYSLWSLLSMTLPPGDYYVMTSALSSSDVYYNYTLNFTQVDLVEIPLSTGLNGPFNINSTHRIDLFSFTASEYSNIQLRTSGTTGYPVMYLYDSSFQLLDSDYYSAYPWSLINYQGGPDTFYATLEAFSGTNVVDYYVNLVVTNPLGTDGNGLRWNATVINLGDNGPFDLDPADDDDWYNITFTSDGLAEFDLSGSGSTRLSLYGPSAYALATDYDSGEGEMSWLAYSVTAGTYSILIENNYGSSLIGYHIFVSLGVVPSDDNDDDFSNATAIGEGVFGPADLIGYEEDYYVYTTTGPGTIRAEVNGLRGGAYVYLYDSDENVLAYPSSTSNNSFTVVSHLDDAGTYYIVVSTIYSIPNVLGYNLTITFTPWVSVDGNDFRSTAQRLVPGLNGPFSITPYSDEDWFFVDQVEDGLLVIEAWTNDEITLELQDINRSQLSGGIYGYTYVSTNDGVGRYYLWVRSYYSSYVVDQYFLNLTVPDTTPPSIGVSSITNGASVGIGALTVAGTVEPGAALTVNGVPTFADSNGAFSTVVAISAGSNTINITATDKAGYTTSRELVIIGTDPNAALQAQIAAQGATITTTQNSLAAAQADALVKAQALAAAQAAAENQSAAQNATLATTQAELQAARGTATTMMALAAVGFLAAIAVAAMLMRKKPPMVDAPAPMAPPMPNIPQPVVAPAPLPSPPTAPSPPATPPPSA